MLQNSNGRLPAWRRGRALCSNPLRGISAPIPDARDRVASWYNPDARQFTCACGQRVIHCVVSITVRRQTCVLNAVPRSMVRGRRPDSARAALHIDKAGRKPGLCFLISARQGSSDLNSSTERPECLISACNIPIPSSLCCGTERFTGEPAFVRTA